MKERKVIVRLKSMVRLLVVLPVLLFALQGMGAIAAEQPYKGETITVATFIFTSMDAAREMLPEFTKETGIKVVYDQMPHEQLRDKLLSQAMMHTGKYDVMWLDTINVAEFVQGEYLFPLTEWVERDWDELDMDDIPQNLWDYALRFEGEWWGMPSANHLGVSVYRKDLYDEYGLTPAETWQEQQEISKKLTLDTNGDGEIDVYGYAFRGKRGENLLSDLYHWSGPFASYDSIGGSGLFYPNWKAAIDSPDIIAAVENMLGFHLDLAACPPDVIDFGWNELMNAASQGRIASFVTEQFAAAVVSDPAESKVWDKVGFYRPPGHEYAPGKIRRRPYAGGAFPWVINADSKHKGAAWEFLKWISSKEQHHRYVDLGGTEFRYSVMNDPEMQAKKPWLKYMAEVADTCGYRELWTETDGLREAGGIALSKALIGEWTVMDAMIWLNEEAQKLSEDAGYYKG